MVLNKLRFLPTTGKMFSILAGTFITSATYWMTWPFLAIILRQSYSISASYIGCLFSLSTLISTLAGIYFGYLSDKIGIGKMMALGCIVGAIAFILLAISDGLNTYIGAIILVGLANSILDPLGKAIFADITQHYGSRHTALQIRYWTVNTGVAIGPLIGAYLGIAAKPEAFFVPAFTFFIYLLLLCPIFAKNNNAAKIRLSNRDNRFSFIDVLKLLINDHAFLTIVAANILLWIVFVQFESSLVLYLSIFGASSLPALFSMILSTNAITVVVLQLPLMKLMKPFTISTKIYSSICLLAITQLMFAFIPQPYYLWWIIATISYSIAEIILVPNVNINIDQMAPENLKGSYFAVSFLYKVGFGSFIGGLLLDKVGGRGLFIAMFFVCCVAAFLYLYARKLIRPNFEQ